MKNAETTDISHRNALLEQLYTTYSQCMYRRAMAILQNHEDAEDAVQHSFVQIAQNISYFQNISSSKTKNLVMAIVRNKSIDLYRHNAILMFTSLADAQDIFWEASDLITLQSCIDQLPEKYKSALILKYIHGYTTEEASHILKVSPEALRKRSYRAKLMLMQMCAEEGLL